MEDQPFKFEFWFPTTILVLSLLSTMSNCASAIKVWHTYDIRKAIYLVLFVDSCRATLFYVITTSTCLVFLISPEKGHGIVGCFFMHTFVFLVTNLGILTVSSISCIRYNLLVNGYTDSRNMWQAVVAMTLSMLIITPYYICIKAYMDYNMIFPFVEICINGEDAKVPRSPWMIALMTPQVFAVVIAVVMDAKTYHRVSTHVSSSHMDQHATGNEVFC